VSKNRPTKPAMKMWLFK